MDHPVSVEYWSEIAALDFLASMLDDESFNLYLAYHFSRKSKRTMRGDSQDDNIGPDKNYDISKLLRMSGHRRALILRKYPRLKQLYLKKVVRKVKE